jgi:hypothetical protein
MRFLVSPIGTRKAKDPEYVQYSTDCRRRSAYHHIRSESGGSHSSTAILNMEVSNAT